MSIADFDKVLIHEYEQTSTGQYDYLPPGAAVESGWAKTERVFLLYKNSTTGRKPVYRTQYTYGGAVDSYTLTASSDPESLTGITTRSVPDNPIGYIETVEEPHNTQMYQHWGKPSHPYAYRYDSESTLPAYVSNTKINNEDAFMPKVLSFDVSVASGEVIIRNEAGNEVTEINVRPGDSNLIHFQAAPGLAFATLSLYCLNADGTLEPYDGRFLVHKWSERQVRLIDDNRQVTVSKDYNFLISMYDGENFYNHDPKFTNRGSTTL